MLAQGQDFAVETTHGIIRCIPKTPQATSAYKTLQFQLMRIVPQLPDAPPVTINVDGVIGPSTVLVAQIVAGRLAEGKHSELGNLAMAQPEEAIPFVAANAMEIAGYIDKALEAEPQALLAPMPASDQQVSGPTLKEIFTGKRIFAGALAILGIGGIALVARASDKRASGTMDRSYLLPDSDGSDQFDEADYEEVEEIDQEQEHASM